jgi:hypothetical protein
MKLNHNENLVNISLSYLINKAINESHDHRTLIHQKYNFIKYFGKHEDIAYIFPLDTLDIYKSEYIINAHLQRIVIGAKTLMYEYTEYIDIIWIYYIYTRDVKYKKIIQYVANTPWYYCFIRSRLLQKLSAIRSIRSVNAMENGSFSTNDMLDYIGFNIIMEKNLLY